MWRAPGVQSIDFTLKNDSKKRCHQLPNCCCPLLCLCRFVACGNRSTGIWVTCHTSYIMHHTVQYVCSFCVTCHTSYCTSVPFPSLSGSTHEPHTMHNLSIDEEPRRLCLCSGKGRADKVASSVKALILYLVSHRLLKALKAK